MKPKWRFSIFWIILLFFFWIFLGMPMSGRNGTRNGIFFISFSAYPYSICLEMKQEWCFFFLFFFNYFTFFLFFIFLGMSRAEIVLGTKFFFFFFVPSQPCLSINEAKMTFFSFLNFFAIFLGMLQLRSSSSNPTNPFYS